MTQQCDEFDRLQELNTEAAKRIRHFLRLEEKTDAQPSMKYVAARNDLEDIAERIERGQWPV